MRILKYTFLLLLVCGISQVRGQRITGYFPNYNYTASNYLNIQWDKMTHLYYFSLNPTGAGTGQSDGSLWFNDGFSWFTTAYFNNVTARARLINPDIKIFIVTGGAPGGDWDLNARLSYIASNASRLNNFCNNICSFIKNNDLDGWDLDWEFPTDATSRNNHEAMLAKMRQKIDSMKTADCKHYEITIAVGGGYTDVGHACWNPAHTDYVNANVINYVDVVNIMTYDGNIGGAPCSFSSHQHYNLVVKALADWTANYPTWPKSKLAVGVGFYDNHDPTAVEFSAGGNNSTWYNQNYWGDGGGSGCPNMQAKVDYARTQGTAGTFIWELTQDNLCSGTVPACYSLLDCIYQRTISTWGTWTAPDPPPPCTMPVVLTEFTGSKQENFVHLSWTTAEETDHDYFVLQRSEDGIVFEDVTRIESGESNQWGASYFYNDPYHSAYYRLKIVSNTGLEEFSKVIAISNTNPELPSLYPNPFDEVLTLVLPESGKSELKVFTISGQEIFSEKNITGGEINLGEDWMKGVYFIQVISSKNIFNYKVVKR